MTLVLKDPDAVLDYAVDWGVEYLEEDDLIADSSWSVSPSEADGVTVAGSDFDAKVSKVTAAGGVAGKLYRLMNHVTFQSGRSDERSVTLRVERR